MKKSKTHWRKIVYGADMKLLIQNVCFLFWVNKTHNHGKNNEIAP